MRRHFLILLAASIGCSTPPETPNGSAPPAARLPAADSLSRRVDNTYVFELPDSGGYLFNGHAVTQASIPAHLSTLFRTRALERRVVMVRDNPQRRGDAQWVARAAQEAGGHAFDAELSGWPSPVSGWPP